MNKYIIFFFCLALTLVNCKSDDDLSGITPVVVQSVDTDGDGIPDNIDNCSSIPNQDQADTNNNGIGDACEGNGLTPLFPCVNGMAGPFPCDGIDIMSVLSTDVLAGNASADGSDVWGWTDVSTGKEYAIIGMSNATAFVDISNPTAPINLGRIATAQGSAPWRDVKVYNNHAFIVADGNSNSSHGMQVFDLTRLRNVANPPENFTVDALFTGVGKCHNIVINESEGVAYLVGCNNTNNGGPIFVDISNPANPTLINDYEAAGYTHDAQVVTYNGPDPDYQGREIYIGSNGNTDTVAILDVTDKDNVISISEFTYPQTAYAHQGWFTEDQRYFILGDELDETGFGFNTKTLVFNFTDLDNPVLSSTYFGPSPAIDHNGYVKGNEYYLANYRAGMRILNIDNIANSSNPMTETHFIDTFPDNDFANFNGVWSIYPYFQSGNIVIGDIERGMFIVRKQ